MSSSPFDVCIRGAGIVGQVLALALAREKLRVALVEPAPAAPRGGRDVRAYALNSRSQALLQSLRCWPAAAATPVARMQVWGDGAGALAFDAAAVAGQGGVSQPLAWIVDVPELEDLLRSAVRYQPQVEVLAEPVAAPLTAICEGRHSQTREALGVEYQSWAYPQHAVATRLRSDLLHQGAARQWFTGEDVLALLPLGGAQGREFAVVWSTGPEKARQLVQAADADFVAQLQEIVQRPRSRAEADAQTHEHFALIAPRASWPLRLARASRWTGSFASAAPQRHWVLLGDAAHAVHPLAGSGLNLGLGDVRELVAQIGQRQGWRSPGDSRILRNYERARKSALLPFAAATDGLQQLFSRPEVPAQRLRNWGMQGVDRSGRLKGWLARQAMDWDA